jgi:hypothetical protein
MQARSIGRAFAGLAGTAILSAGVAIGAMGTAQAAGPVSTQASTSEQWQITHTVDLVLSQQDTYFELRAQHSDKCLDVDGRGPGGPGADLANVQQYHCSGGLNQHWRMVDVGGGYFELRAQHSDKCLDVDGRGPGGPGADLANVQQYHCSGGLNQHWRMVAA